ncbi:hypothetical protein CFP75_30710 [Amycolatopsis alba DSM 44262]|uniref:Uncharacterized protein n=1 Tax=Amycolatopsis alba DSM 44262 TaxID=1125972 RepID=A0A229RF86_AMYAL|nr:hypothetical protein CFP75_30710 [Amycolatopsis alba DSM 44262]
MVRVVSGVSWVVVVAGVSGGDGVDVCRGPVATVFGTSAVVAGTTWPVLDPPAAHAPSSTPTPTTRPQHHTRMGPDPNSHLPSDRPKPTDRPPLGVVSSALSESGRSHQGGVDS